MKILYRSNVQNVWDTFYLPVKNIKSRTTAKVSVFVLHIVNKQSNHPKTKAWHIIFIIQWIYTRDNYLQRNFHEKIYIVSMSMNTSAQGRPSLLQCITFQSLLFLKNFLGMRGKYFFGIFIVLIFLYVSPTTKQKQKGKKST